MIERDVQLCKLEALAQAVNHDGGAIALVSGEAGIGKTTLLQAFQHSLQGNLIVRWGSCDPLATPRVLGPILDMYGQFNDDVRKALNGEIEFSSLVSVMLEQLQTSASPGVMIVEDAHWADNATLDLLKCIGRRISFLNTLLIISYRSDEISKTHPLFQAIGDFPQARLHRIPLSPISEKGVEKLARNAGKGSAGLHAVTAGNPFYITEYLTDDLSDSGNVPESIQDAVGARVNRLDSSYQSFLETISVIPHTIEATLVNTLFGSDGPTLTGYCIERNFLKPDGLSSYRFCHELARLGTLARVPVFRRQEIHSRIFTILEAGNLETTLDQKLFHAVAARQGDKVLQLAPMAGANAATAGSHAEAASHFANALVYVDQATDEEAAGLYESWSYEAALVAIDDKTIDARHRALALWRKLGRAEKIGENLRWLSRQHWYRGESDLANRYITEAISTLENIQPSAERAMAYSLNSQYQMLNDRMEDAIDFGNKALQLELQFPSPEVRIHALNNIGTAMLIRDNRQGLDHLDCSLQLALQHEFHEHAARCYTNIASATVGGLDYSAAEQAIADGIVFDTKHDLDSWTHYLIGLMSQLRMEQSRFEEAETIAAGVMQMENPTLLMKLPSLLVLSKVSMRHGRDNARELLQQALCSAKSVGELQYICPARCGLIEAAWHEGNFNEATNQLEKLIPINSIPASSWRGAEFGVWAFRYGMTLKSAIHKPLPQPYQLEIEGKHEQASEAWIRKGNPYQAALALLHADSGDLVGHFTRALSLLESCSAKGTIKTLRRLAIHHAIDDQLPTQKRGPRKTTRKHPLGLTVKEQTILPLVIQGKSNREISEVLSRSPRTVENHVASILKKLNVNNRMEAMLRGKNEPWLLSNGTRSEVSKSPGNESSVELESIS